jgi:hypothetical protein
MELRGPLPFLFGEVVARIPDAARVSSWFFPPWSSGVEGAAAAPNTSVARRQRPNNLAVRRREGMER